MIDSSVATMPRRKRPVQAEERSPAEQAILTYCGNQIRHARRQRGWSGADLGEKVDLSDSMISALERGQQWVRVEKLIQLATVLEIPPMALFPPDAQGSLFAQAMELFLRATPAQQASMIGFLRAWLPQRPPAEC